MSATTDEGEIEEQGRTTLVEVRACRLRGKSELSGSRALERSDSLQDLGKEKGRGSLEGLRPRIEE